MRLLEKRLSSVTLNLLAKARVPHGVTTSASVDGDISACSVFGCTLFCLCCSRTCSVWSRDRSQENNNVESGLTEDRIFVSGGKGQLPQGWLGSFADTVNPCQFPSPSGRSHCWDTDGELGDWEVLSTRFSRPFLVYFIQKRTGHMETTPILWELVFICKRASWSCFWTLEMHYLCFQGVGKIGICVRGVWPKRYL